MDALRAHFRPEFLNRIDEIIFFHALEREHMKQIVDIQLPGLMKRLEERKIHVELTDAAKELLVREGYDPAYGARPLKRTIQRRVLDPLALRVLEGEFGEGDTVVVDAGSGDGLTFEKQETVQSLDAGASEAQTSRQPARRAPRPAAGRAPGVVALVRPRRCSLLLGARADVLPGAGRAVRSRTASSRRW